MLPATLPETFRAKAAQLARYAPAAAEAFTEAAELAEEALSAAANETLTPQQIEDAGICAAETVRRAVRAGEVENAGTPGKILVRRGDLGKLPRGRITARGAQQSGAESAAPALSGDLARRLARQG